MTDIRYAGVIALTAEPITFKHPGYSFFSVQNGSLIIASDTLSACQPAEQAFFFIPPDQTCRFSSPSGCVLICLCLDYLLCEEVFGPQAYQFFLPYSRPVRTETPILPLLLQILRLNRQADNSGHFPGHALRTSILYRFLAEAGQLLYEPASAGQEAMLPDIRFHGRDSSHMTASRKTRAKADRITDYISKNYVQQLTLQETAARFSLTPQYMTSLLRRATGLSFSEYVTRIRLEHARDLLAYSSEHPLVIAGKTGFLSLSAFERAFEQYYGTTAEQFGRLHAQFDMAPFAPDPDDITELYIRSSSYTLNYAMSDEAIFRSDVSLQTQTFPVDLRQHSGHGLHNPCTQIINLGNAADFILADYRIQIMRLQEYGRFVWGRILRPFDLALTDDANGASGFSMVHLFRMIDFCHQIHLSMWFDLDSRPGIKAPDPAGPASANVISRDPSDHRSFICLFLRQFLKESLNRYDLNYIRTWHFELNMPYDEAMQPLMTADAYIQYFQEVRDLIHSWVPECAVGGSAFDAALTAPLSSGSDREAEPAANTPDFISLSLYTDMCEPDLFRSRLSEMLRRLQHTNMKRIPVFITEYALDRHLLNPLHDSVFLAALIARLSTEFFELTEGLAYRLTSDISLVTHAGHETLFGGCGLLSHLGIPKPGLHALSFFRHCDGSILQHGSHHLLCGRPQAGRFQLILHNHAWPDPAGSLRPGISGKHPQSPRDVLFESVPPLSLCFELNGARPGQYRIRHYTIGPGSGDLYEEWYRLGLPGNLDDIDTAYLSRAALPRFEQRFIDVSGDLLTLRCLVRPQEVQLYLIDHMI